MFYGSDERAHRIGFAVYAAHSLATIRQRAIRRALLSNIMTARTLLA